MPGKVNRVGTGSLYGLNKIHPQEGKSIVPLQIKEAFNHESLFALYLLITTI